VYPVIFTLAARAELIDAKDWYENDLLAWAEISALRLTP
jgi:hypothetical protein